MNISISRFAALGFAAVLLAAPGDAAASPSPDAGAAIASWNEDIAGLPLPAAGCFAAVFPERAWHATECMAAPHRPYLPAHGGHAGPFTVGNGVDYGLVTTSLIPKAMGSFPAVSGLKSETGYGGAANDYSLQLNTGFMWTAACAKGTPECLSWQQFIYSSGYKAVFMQYWLINYNTDGKTCPSSAWYAYGNDCYTNSNAVTAPQISATKLGGVSVFGSAARNGTDEVKLTAGGKAYAVSGADGVLDLATGWTQNEFNVVGDGGGSQAKFNSGTSITVKVKAYIGKTTVPACPGYAGTTGETNNLTLGASCTASAGIYPSIEFTESN